MKLKWYNQGLKLFFQSIGMAFKYIYGVYKLSKLQQPLVTVFGGKGAGRENFYAQQAYDVSKLLVKNNFSVLTGGGPGIMESANCGALKAEKDKAGRHTLGIGVVGVDLNFENKCTQVLYFPYLFMREWFLIRYSVGYIVFPGGLGTAEEIFEVLNLIKLSKIPRRPLILVGPEYWKPILDWHASGIEQGFIPDWCKDLIKTAKDANEAFKILQDDLQRH